MDAHDVAPTHAVRRLAAAAILLGFAAFPAVGCDSANQPDLRADLAAIHSAHGDPEAIGTLDATAPPPDLNAYRKPEYRAVSAR
jgi:hypothetical protein